jgi:hypothetical protein
MLHTCPISASLATCLAHFILIDLTILILYAEKYKLWSCSVCKFFRRHITFSLLLFLSSTGHSPCREANIHPASQEIIRLLWIPKVHYRVHKSRPLVPILSQMNLVYSLPIYLFKIPSNKVLFYDLCLALPSGPFLSGFPTKILHVFVISPCPTIKTIPAKSNVCLISVGFWRWCVSIERIALLDFIHRLVSQKLTN